MPYKARNCSLLNHNILITSLVQHSYNFGSFSLLNLFSWFFVFIWSLLLFFHWDIYFSNFFMSISRTQPPPLCSNSEGFNHLVSVNNDEHGFTIYHLYHLQYFWTSVEYSARMMYSYCFTNFTSTRFHLIAHLKYIKSPWPWEPENWEMLRKHKTFYSSNLISFSGFFVLVLVFFWFFFVFFIYCNSKLQIYFLSE